MQDARLSAKELILSIRLQLKYAFQRWRIVEAVPSLLMKGTTSLKLKNGVFGTAHNILIYLILNYLYII
jgi:hypothetical protein